MRGMVAWWGPKRRGNPALTQITLARAERPVRCPSLVKFRGTFCLSPVVDGGEIRVGRRMKMTISCDHRVMDGAMGARFLQDLKRLLEEPLRLLV